jgi:hypothetical protein
LDSARSSLNNRDALGDPLVAGGEAIAAVSRNQQVIGKRLVDQVWAEGSDPAGRGCSRAQQQPQRRLQPFEKSSEGFMTKD